MRADQALPIEGTARGGDPVLLNILQRKSTERAAFKSIDRLVFAALYRLVPGVLDALKNLKPETVPSTRYRPRDFEETSSILGMADAFLAHVLGNGGLPNIDAELEQFAMNPRCTPKRVLNTHVSNELTNPAESLVGHRAMSISSANRLGIRRGANGSPSPG